MNDGGGDRAQLDTRDQRAAMRDALRQDLARRNFTHFVTLASNHQVVPPGVMRQRLKAWDAKVNRALLGGRWTKRLDERLVWIAFPEKGDVNPHWHLLVQVDGAPRTAVVAERLLRLGAIIDRAWSELQPHGTSDTQAVASITDPGYTRVIGYATKCLQSGENFDQFILYREFWS